MYKKKSLFLALLILVGCSLFNIAIAQDGPAASSTIKKEGAAQGILQAYWAPSWNDDGSKDTPKLVLRFFAQNSAHHTDFIAIFYNKKDSDNNILDDDFENEQIISMIKRSFSHIPDNFFRFKEGHIEQYGSATYTEAFSNTECQDREHFAHFINFIKGGDQSININELENSAGCNPAPYMEAYTLKHKDAGVHFKSAPNKNSADGALIPLEESLIKIQTIDSDWVYVAVFDDNSPELQGKVRGYVLQQDLQPMD
jgi:hypothetical protein